MIVRADPVLIVVASILIIVVIWIICVIIVVVIVVIMVMVDMSVQSVAVAIAERTVDDWVVKWIIVVAWTRVEMDRVAGYCN